MFRTNYLLIFMALCSGVFVIDASADEIKTTATNPVQKTRNWTNKRLALSAERLLAKLSTPSDDEPLSWLKADHKRLSKIIEKMLYRLRRNWLAPEHKELFEKLLPELRKHRDEREAIIRKIYEASASGKSLHDITAITSKASKKGTYRDSLYDVNAATSTIANVAYTANAINRIYK